MLTLQVASQNLDFKHKIGTFSQTMNMLIDKHSSVEEESNNKIKIKENKKIESTSMVKHGSLDNSAIIENEEEDQEELDMDSIGLTSFLHSKFSFAKRFFRLNFTNLAFNISFLLLLRECSLKFFK